MQKCHRHGRENKADSSGSTVFHLSQFTEADHGQCPPATSTDQSAYQRHKVTAQGTITLELVKQTEDTALFSVSDTGCGISKENQNKIFNRFEKLDENAQGTGLGLSICQLIIEQLGGKIWIDPDYDKGARFLFTHPICHAQIKKEETR